MKLHGIIGLVLIILTELNFYFKIEPFAYWYFPLIWTGYILFIDAIVYKLKGNSLLINRPGKFIFCAVLSLIAWWIFEIINFQIGNWSYHVSSAIQVIPWQQELSKHLSFATVIPAVFETADLLFTLHSFDKTHLQKKHKISKTLLYTFIILGLISLTLPLLLPNIFYPLIWLSFFFFLDPINYMNKQPSLIQHWKDSKLKIPLTFAFASLICGFLWEFWNYWAVRKWIYHIPYVDFFKIFEMPILGYLGYLPFGLELFAIVIFANYIIKRYIGRTYSL